MKKQNAEFSKCCVVTVVSGRERGFEIFKRSCEKNGIHPVVLGLEQPYRCNFDKLRYLNEFLNRRGSEYSHVLFCDGYDVVVASSLSNVLDVYHSFNTPIVFSAEKNCWPEPERAEEHPPSPTPIRFLNSGLWMGEINAVKRLITRVLGARSKITRRFGNHPKRYTQDDQFHLTQTFLTGDTEITLDYQTRLFHSMHLAEEDLAWEASSRRIRNKLTGQYPCAFHGNANSNLFQVLSNLKLVPDLDEAFEIARKNGLMAPSQYAYIRVCSKKVN